MYTTLNIYCDCDENIFKFLNGSNKFVYRAISLQVETKNENRFATMRIALSRSSTKEYLSLSSVISRLMISGNFLKAEISATINLMAPFIIFYSLLFRCALLAMNSADFQQEKL